MMKTLLGATGDVARRANDAIEHFWERLFIGQRSLQLDEVAARLEQELQEKAVDDAGAYRAPDNFEVRLHPDDYRHLFEESGAPEQALAERIRQAAEERNYELARPPRVWLQRYPDRLPRSIEIVSQFSDSPIQAVYNAASGYTVPLSLPRLSQTRQPHATLRARRRGAYGNKIYDLDQPLIRIGRLPNKDIVLSDPHVSLDHAEIRYSEHRYQLQDLGSLNGTYLNGERVFGSVLNSGDRISFAGYEMDFRLE